MVKKNCASLLLLIVSVALYEPCLLDRTPVQSHPPPSQRMSHRPTLRSLSSPKFADRLQRESRSIVLLQR
jgi:hypothetical protein